MCLSPPECSACNSCCRPVNLLSSLAYDICSLFLSVLTLCYLALSLSFECSLFQPNRACPAGQLMTGEVTSLFGAFHVFCKQRQKRSRARSQSMQRPKGFSQPQRAPSVLAQTHTGRPSQRLHCARQSFFHRHRPFSVNQAPLVAAPAEPSSNPSQAAAPAVRIRKSSSCGPASSHEQELARRALGGLAACTPLGPKKDSALASYPHTAQHVATPATRHRHGSPPRRSCTRCSRSPWRARQLPARRWARPRAPTCSPTPCSKPKLGAAGRGVVASTCGWGLCWAGAARAPAVRPTHRDRPCAVPAAGQLQHRVQTSAAGSQPSAVHPTPHAHSGLVLQQARVEAQVSRRAR